MSRTLFVSDTHLGFRFSRARDLLRVLETETYDRLILVGDIFDIQQARKRPYIDEYHTKVAKKILKIARKKDVIYVLGNHDWDIASVLPYTKSFARVRICKYYSYWTSRDGSPIHVGCIHGHQFDNIPRHIALVGDFLYNIGLRANSLLNRIRRVFGLPYFSYSKWCKDKAKSLIARTLNIHDKQLNFCDKYHYDVLITGHTHMPRIDEVGNKLLVNTGAFVEIATYVIEENGNFELKEI